MLRRITAISVIAVLISVTTNAFATIINFDDIDSWLYAAPDGSYKNAFVPTTYKGFWWSGGMYDSSWVVSTGPEPFPFFVGKVTTSGANFAWSNGGTNGAKPQLSLSSWNRNTFDLNGFNARFGWFESGTSTFIGYRDGLPIITKTIDLTLDYQYYALNMLNVDRIEMRNNGANVLFDDIEVNRVSVPEPASLALFIAGMLVGVGAVRRRRQRV